MLDKLNATGFKLTLFTVGECCWSSLCEVLQLNGRIDKTRHKTRQNQKPGGGADMETYNCSFIVFPVSGQDNKIANRHARPATAHARTTVQHNQTLMAWSC